MKKKLDIENELFEFITKAQEYNTNKAFTNQLELHKGYDKLKNYGYKVSKLSELTTSGKVSVYPIREITYAAPKNPRFRYTMDAVHIKLCSDFLDIIINYRNHFKNHIADSTLNFKLENNKQFGIVDSNITFNSIIKNPQHTIIEERKSVLSLNELKQQLGVIPKQKDMIEKEELAILVNDFYMDVANNFVPFNNLIKKIICNNMPEINNQSKVKLNV